MACVSSSHTSQTALQLLEKSTHEKQDTISGTSETARGNEVSQPQNADTVTGDI